MNYGTVEQWMVSLIAALILWLLPLTAEGREEHRKFMNYIDRLKLHSSESLCILREQAQNRTGYLRYYRRDQ